MFTFHKLNVLLLLPNSIVSAFCSLFISLSRLTCVFVSLSPKTLPFIYTQTLSRTLTLESPRFGVTCRKQLKRNGERSSELSDEGWDRHHRIHVPPPSFSLIVATFLLVFCRFERGNAPERRLLLLSLAVLFLLLLLLLLSQHTCCFPSVIYSCAREHPPPPSTPDSAPPLRPETSSC